MAEQSFVNNVSLIITEFLGSTDTVISVANTDGLLPLIGDDYYIATIVPVGGFGSLEIIKINSFSGNTLFVERAQEGTGAQNFLFGARLELRITAGTLDNLRNGQGVVNQLWMGELAYWPMGHALLTSNTQRVPIPAGVTIARDALTGGVTVYHIPGVYRKHGMRIQRNATNADASAANVVMNLTKEEAATLIGKPITSHFHVRKSSSWTGSTVSIRLQTSLEPEQPILSSTGVYTNGNIVLAQGTVVPTENYTEELKPSAISAIVPSDSLQVAVVISVTFSGVAPADDYVDIEGISLYNGTKVSRVAQPDFQSLVDNGKSRYQTTYPYAVPRGSVTNQGTVSVVAINTNTGGVGTADWALSFDVRFERLMVTVPQFIFQAPTSNTESRWLDMSTGLFVNGVAYNLSDSGVTITNTGTPIAGRRYICHWTAQVIF